MHKAFEIGARMEISKGGNVFLNNRRIELLKQIRSTGSILAASKEMRISYQMAWTYIKEINALSPLPVVVRQRGGSNGGGATLTKYGLMLVGKYLQMDERLHEFLKNFEADLDDCFF
ncbi:MAG: LysR family transcriptional regulator [Tannerella sp.]|jgi:molybdate transport system regulatory protein|nr:LysR family transcriptional regulator [Tannerella sp.]